MTSQQLKQSSQYEYLNNVKWVLAVLVILHHSAAIAGLDPIGFNFPKVLLSNQWQYQILGDFQGINQSFFMAAFFFISALFVVPSYEKKGATQFMMDKLKRLGIPVLIWLFIIYPLLGATESSNVAISNITGLFQSGQIELGVTWFCWTLIVFNLIWLVAAKITKSNSSEIKPKPLPAIWKIIAFAVVMLPINLLGLHIQNQLGANFLGFHLLKYFPMYIAAFAFGIYAYRSDWINKIEFKHAFVGILMWIFAKAFLAPALSGYGINSDVACRGFTVIGMCLFLIYAFKVLFNNQSRFTKLLSRSAYAAYVFQVPFLFLVAKVYQPHMTQTPLLNFAVVAVPSVILSFCFAYLVCKMPYLRRIF